MPDPVSEHGLIHTRTYEVQVFRVDDETVSVRGVVVDTKPPGLYVREDPDPLEIHQMHIELEVKLADLEIVGARVVFETHPHDSCPTITEHYQKLIGLNIARGFTHRVRELFGGPRGCTHTTALLQAMAPAVVQSTWSMSVLRAQAEGLPAGSMGPTGTQSRVYDSSVNSCHVWDENGDHASAALAGDPVSVPLPIRRRLLDLELAPTEWRLG